LKPPLSFEPAMNHLMNTYARQPVGFVRGEGVWLWDEAGTRYLDGVSGVGVTSLGHCHPKVVNAICEQARSLLHTSNLYRIFRQEELADLICKLSGMDEVFFCSSGAEANEAAIKLARLYGHKNGTENSHIVVMEKAWHGRTLATLSATGSRKAQAGFEPLMSGFIRVPYNDLAAVKQVADTNRSIVAVLIEVLQGEGGVNVADLAYIGQLRALCDQQNWLLMIDEVQSGIGRTGQWFGFQHAGVTPDVMTLAKGLGSGVPIGACAGRGRVKGVFTPGTHGATFGGGPLVCAAALATLNTLAEEGVLENATRIGEWIRCALKESLSALPGVKEIRGMGLMIGVELDRPCGEIVKHCLQRNVLINVTADKVVRLLPPLTITQDEAKLLVDTVAPAIKEFLAA
jgi:acetylornithine/N-succinyldiaminopimelate aminotransferase